MSAKIRRLFKQMHWLAHTHDYFLFLEDRSREGKAQREEDKAWDEKERRMVKKRMRKKEKETKSLRKRFFSKEGVWVEFKMVPFYFLCRKMSRIMLINDFRFGVSRKTRSSSLTHALKHTLKHPHAQMQTHLHTTLTQTHKPLLSGSLRVKIQSFLFRSSSQYMD